ncbi:MAG: oxidoreductase [Schleiferiaceae bacterium]
MRKVIPALVFVAILAIPVFIFLFRAPAENSLWEAYRILKVSKDNFRALAADGGEVYAASKNGQFVYSTDTGATWQFEFVDSVEIRSIALTEDEIFLASAGTPCRIYKSPRRTINFEVIFEKTADLDGKDWFLDAAKADSKGNVWFFGDVRAEFDTTSAETPTDTQYVPTLLVRRPNGEIEYKYPPMNSKEEYGFAAGNACLEVRGDTIHIVTGGSLARWFTSVDGGNQWSVQVLPYSNGPSKGAFGVTIPNSMGVIVGGDYAIDSLNQNTTFYTRDAGAHWFPSKGVNGYLSDVVYLGESAFMATGTQGTCWTVNGGQTWEFINDKPYNTIEVDSDGNIWVAGPEAIGHVIIRSEE